MEDHRLAPEQITAFGQYLHTEERSPGTVEKHLRDVRGFAAWLNGKPVTREVAAEWKEHRLSQHYAPSTINSMLAALNSLFRFLGWREHRVRFFNPASTVSRHFPRTVQKRLQRADYRGAGTRPRATDAVDGNHLRHLFARTFYNVSHDIAKLADVLGHSSIETTRIYLLCTGTEHAKQLERLGLIL